MLNKKNVLLFSVVLAVLATNVFFGFPRLSEYSSVDEPYWTYDRTPDFWKAVSEGRWERTDINDKPGITVAEISGFGLLSGITPLDYKSLRQEPKTPEVYQEFVKINFSLRLPIYLACLSMLVILFFFIKKLLGLPIAIFSLIFIGLSPIVLGISLIINPDSLLWGFLPLSILGFLIYQKTDNKKYLIFSGIFLGLSLLTKYVANILYVYLLGLIFLNFIYSKRNDFYVYIKKTFLDYGILILTSLIAFFILYPACWNDPNTLLEGTLFSAAFKTTWPIFAGFLGLILTDLFFTKARFFSIVMNFLSRFSTHFKILISLVFFSGIVFVFTNTYSGMPIFDFEGEMASPKGANTLTVSHIIKIVSSDIYGLVFGLIPLVFLFFAFAIGRNALGKSHSRENSNIVLYFSFFILFYYLASTINQVTATVRYQIVLYPLASIIAAIGVWEFFQTEKLKKYLENGTVYAGLFVISFFSLFVSSPHFFNYTSSLLPHNYILNLKDMGDGSFEAAQFLNSLPDAQNLIVWSDKGAVCETFVGKCKVSFNKSDRSGNFDYFILSVGRKSRSLKLEQSNDFDPAIDFPKAYADDFSESELQINFNKNPRNFVRVIKTEKILDLKKEN